MEEINQGKDDNFQEGRKGAFQRKNISVCVCNKSWSPGGQPEVQIPRNTLCGAYSGQIGQRASLSVYFV